MDKVRAKFFCYSVNDENDNKTVKMTAVCGDEGEDAVFQKYTPSGTFDMLVSKETQASEFFQPGKNYYLDITEAPQ